MIVRIFALNDLKLNIYFVINVQKYYVQIVNILKIDVVSLFVLIAIMQ
jgi:hypothetical protein